MMHDYAYRCGYCRDSKFIRLAKYEPYSSGQTRNTTYVKDFPCPNCQSYSNKDDVLVLQQSVYLNHELYRAVRNKYEMEMLTREVLVKGIHDIADFLIKEECTEIVVHEDMMRQCTVADIRLLVMKSHKSLGFSPSVKEQSKETTKRMIEDWKRR